MPKVSNTTRGALGFANEWEIPAFGEVELTADQIRIATANEVVAGWIANGAIVIEGEGAGDSAPSTNEKKHLVDDLQSLGIKAKGTWGVERLKAELEKAMA